MPKDFAEDANYVSCAGCEAYVHIHKSVDVDGRDYHKSCAPEPQSYIQPCNRCSGFCNVETSKRFRKSLWTCYDCLTPEEKNKYNIFSEKQQKEKYIIVMGGDYNRDYDEGLYPVGLYEYSESLENLIKNQGLVYHKMSVTEPNTKVILVV